MNRFKRIVAFALILAVAITGSMVMSVQTVSAAEQQVASKNVVTKVTTKTTNKSVKMKTKAKKSKTTTKITTKKSSKVITKNAEKKVTQDKTVKTTVKTTFTKKSKTKKIKTTVKTTTKTTTIKYKKEKKETIESIRKAVPKDALDAFDQLGFKIKINGKLETEGAFSTTAHSIELKSAKAGVLLHEMGHFVSCLKGRAAESDEFNTIYKAEKNKYTGSNKKYVIATNDEYFAESYRDYIERPDLLKKERPKTYIYMNNTAHSITQQDIDDMRELYGGEW